MEQFKADTAIFLAHLLGELECLTDPTKGDHAKPVPEELRSNLARALPLIREEIKTLEIGSTLGRLDGLIKNLADPTLKNEHLHSLVSPIFSLFEHEISSRGFLHLTQKKASFYQIPMDGWDAVLAKLPGGQYDIEEAGKCLALSRNTACVFHLMRLMEWGIVEIGKSLSVTIDPERQWKKMVDDLRRSLNQLRNSKSLPKADDEFYSAICAHLDSVRIAWRNPTMHPGEKYTEEEALDVYSSVRAFLRHFAARP